jgi:predicted DNA-binding transcriptional regulator AlpA
MRVVRLTWVLPLSGNDLLHRVELCAVSGPARELFKQLLREVLTEQGGPGAPVGALRAADAAAYVGVSRSSFYVILKQDPALAAIAVAMGDYRVWRPPDLDQWLQDRRARLTRPKVERAA